MYISVVHGLEARNGFPISTGPCFPRPCCVYQRPPATHFHLSQLDLPSALIQLPSALCPLHSENKQVTKARSLPTAEQHELPLDTDAWSGQVQCQVGSATDEGKWGKHGPLRSISDPRSFVSWVCPEHPENNPFGKKCPERFQVWHRVPSSETPRLDERLTSKESENHTLEIKAPANHSPRTVILSFLYAHCSLFIFAFLS